MKLVCFLASLLLAVPAKTDHSRAQLQIIRELPVSSALVGLAWSSDGKRLAARSNWGRTYAVFTADGKREQEFNLLSDLPLYGNSLAFLDSDRLLLIPHTPTNQTSAMQIFSLWNLTQRRVERDVSGPFPGRPIHDNAAFHFAVSKGETTVAVASSLLPGQPVTLYSALDWSIVAQFNVSSGVSSVALSPDGKMLAIGQVSGAVDVYHLGSGKPTKKILMAYDSRMTVPIAALAFSPDGKFLATGAGLTIAAYKAIPAFKLWQVNSLGLIKSDLPSAAPIRQMSWSRDGTYIALAAGDHTVRVSSPTLHPNDSWISLPFTDATMSLGFSPVDDKLAVAAGAKVELFSFNH